MKTHISFSLYNLRILYGGYKKCEYGEERMWELKSLLAEKSILGTWSQLHSLVWLELEDVWFMFQRFFPFRCHSHLCMYNRNE